MLAYVIEGGGKRYIGPGEYRELDRRGCPGWAVDLALDALHNLGELDARLAGDLVVAELLKREGRRRG